MNKRVLMIMPSLPFPETGAEQMDRASGIKQLIRLGYDVRVVAKVTLRHDMELVRQKETELGIKIETVPYRYSASGTLMQRIKRFLKVLRHPSFIDGSALEYDDEEMKRLIKSAISNWKPDILWFEYTYLWPLYQLGVDAGIPIITRSANYEPLHFLDEEGRGIINWIKYLAKESSERKVVKLSHAIFAITPDETLKYKLLGHKNVFTLPLRSLSDYISPSCHEVRRGDVLNVFFMGSTYNVAHNRGALEFLIKDVIPLVNEKAKEKVNFYIFGKKIPSDLESYCKDNITYLGYVPNLQEKMSEMDIACIPSLFGSGMQQKIFEPLTLGIPTITSRRGMAGYPFVDGESVLFASDKYSFAQKILELSSNIEQREKLSSGAHSLSCSLFERKVIDDIVYNVIRNLGPHGTQ